MNKKGMTLVEAVAVLGVILIIVIFFGPKIAGIFNITPESTMKTEEEKVASTASIYVNDLCIRPLSSGYHGKCLENIETYSKGEDLEIKYVCLSTLVYDKYISKIYYKEGAKCEGFVTFEKDYEHEIYRNPTTYLSCPGYMTDGIKEFKSDDGEYIIAKCGGSLDIGITSGNGYVRGNDDEDKDKDKDTNKDTDKDKEPTTVAGSGRCPDVSKNPNNMYSGYIIGDVNRDGDLNNVDASLIQYELSTFDQAQKILADVNKDGLLDVQDATEIRNCLQGEESIYNSYVPASKASTRICPKVTKNSKNSYAGYLLGDANKDGKLTEADITRIQSYIKKQVDFNAVDKVIADVNKDGKVDAADALNIQNCLNGSLSAYDNYK